MCASVFVVEDEPLVLTTIARRLEALGHSMVGRAQRGKDALRLLRDSEPDLVLMDIKLIGEMDGIDVATKLREFSDVPVIFVTSFGDEETVQRAVKSSPYGYIMKPFGDRDLATSIEVALGRAAADRFAAVVRDRDRDLIDTLVDYAYALRLADDPIDDELLWSIGSIPGTSGHPSRSFFGFEDLLELVHPEDAGSVSKYISACRSSEAGSIEFRVGRNAEDDRWIRLDTRVSSETEEGRVLQVIYQPVPGRASGTGPDPVEAPATAAALDAVGEGVWIGDVDGVCIFVNDAMTRILGRSRGDLLGSKSLEGLIAPEAAGRTLIERPDGSTTPVLVFRESIDAGTMDTEEIVRLVDLSAREKELEELARDRRLLAQGIQSGGSPIALVDVASAKVIQCSKGFATMLRGGAQDLVGAGLFGLFEYENLTELNELLRLMNSEWPSERKSRIRMLNGTFVEVLIRLDGNAADGLMVIEFDEVG